MTVVEPAGTADTAGDTYPRLLRTPRWRWWRPLLGLLALGFGVVFGGVVITLLAVIVVDGNRLVRRLGRRRTPSIRTPCSACWPTT